MKLFDLKSKEENEQPKINLEDEYLAIRLGMSLGQIQNRPFVRDLYLSDIWESLEHKNDSTKFRRKHNISKKKLSDVIKNIQEIARNTKSDIKIITFQPLTFNKAIINTFEVNIDDEEYMVEIMDSSVIHTPLYSFTNQRTLNNTIYKLTNDNKLRKDNYTLALDTGYNFYEKLFDIQEFQYFFEEPEDHISFCIYDSTLSNDRYEISCKINIHDINYTQFEEFRNTINSYIKSLSLPLDIVKSYNTINNIITEYGIKCTSIEIKLNSINKGEYITMDHILILENQLKEFSIYKNGYKVTIEEDKCRYEKDGLVVETTISEETPHNTLEEINTQIEEIKQLSLTLTNKNKRTNKNSK